MAESGVDQQTPKRVDSSGLRDLVSDRLKRLFNRRKTNRVHEATPVSSTKEVVMEDTQLLTKEQNVKSPERLNRITVPPEKITTKMWPTENPLDREFIDIIKAYFPQMPLDWRILSKKWKDHGDQLTIPSEVSKIRESLGELASRPDVAEKLDEFREALRNKFGDNIPVYRGSGNFESSFTKPPDPSDKFTSVSASLGVAATFGAPINQQSTEEGMVEVTKYVISPEDVIAFTPSWECELVVRRSALEQTPILDETGVKK